MNRLPNLDKKRAGIGEKVRRLREGRRLTQAALASELGISQGRLSELERGAGSFTAEQLLTLLALFNVGVSHFAASPTPREDVLQNSLARLGARHLHERTDVIADDQRRTLSAVIQEALAGGNPRQLTALAPVLVLHIDEVSLPKMLVDLREVGLQQRLGWLVENVVLALTELRAEPAQPRGWTSRARRAEVVLGSFLEGVASALLPARAEAAPDVLDPAIRSAKTLREVQSEASVVSRRWRIATVLQIDDFVAALRAAR